jgi:hypothetical protein
LKRQGRTVRHGNFIMAVQGKVAGMKALIVRVIRTELRRIG